MASAPSSADALQRLLDIMRALRTPDTGCPWDLEQDHTTLTPYIIEEAHEVVDAIETGDDAELVKELGDLLLQIVFHAQIAGERNAFTMADVMTSIADKLVHRHPHVFGDATDARLSADQVTNNWEKLKLQERAGDVRSVLDGVPMAMPALILAYRLGAKAGRVGFDWPGPEDVLTKVDEELDEVREALAAHDSEALEAEIGDVLFTLVNFSRALKVDAEKALRRASRRFAARFRVMEQLAREAGTPLDALSTDAQERLWEKAKAAVTRAERDGAGGYPHTPVDE